ncbi:Phr family secreted Rap phosphatase inhibitor [Bacillus sp. NPDC077411]|uniref:Phr family secreted Rap phosphatase inhibitor n=1 Tax=Bacillus sp. NPDC077411 TaxID=3363947 RepID=UPI0037C78E8E
MKKLGLIALGLSCVGILSFGVSNDSSQLYAYGDYPAPQKTNSAYSHADLPISAHGDTPAPADNRGDGGIINNEAHGDHGGSPSYGHADLPTPQA